MSGMNTNMKGGNGMSEKNAVSEPIGTNRSPVKNLTAYQTAQSLVAVAQQVFDKNLKPIAQANATNSNSNIANYLAQLKNAIDNESNEASSC
jgi:carbon monoxide dehydrogenase subunit G